MKTKTILIFLLFFCSVFVYTDSEEPQNEVEIFDIFSNMNVDMNVENNSFVVTENKVRIRSDASIESEILGVVSKGDIGIFSDKKYNYKETKFSSYNWFKVEINGIDGWIYGEFIQLIDSKMKVEPFALNNSNDIWVITPNGPIYVGMNWTDFINVMGECELDGETEWVKYYKYIEDKMLVERSKFTDRIQYIKVENDVWSLANGYKVGMTTTELIENGAFFEIKDKRINPGHLHAPTYNLYEGPCIIVELDSNETIVAFHISLTGP